MAMIYEVLSLESNIYVAKLFMEENNKFNEEYFTFSSPSADEISVRLLDL